MLLGALKVAGFKSWLQKVAQTGLCKGKLIQGEFTTCLQFRSCSPLPSWGRVVPQITAFPSWPKAAQEWQRAPHHQNRISWAQRAGLSEERVGFFHSFQWDWETQQDQDWLTKSSFWDQILGVDNFLYCPHPRRQWCCGVKDGAPHEHYPSPCIWNFPLETKSPHSKLCCQSEIPALIAVQLKHGCSSPPDFVQILGSVSVSALFLWSCLNSN